MEEKLQVLINYVIKYIPYYKPYQAKKKINIENFPVIRKTNIKDAYYEFISDEYKNKKELVEILDNGNITFPKDKIETVIKNFDSNIIFEKTSGTSGIPFVCVKSYQERLKITKNLWELRKLIDPLITNKNFYALCHTGQKELPYNPYLLEKENIIKLYRFIDTNNFRWLHIPAYLLIKHIKLFDEEEISFNSLKFIENSGNYCSHEDRNLISKYINAKYIDQYGTIETWPIYLNDNINTYINYENIYLELLDENNNVINEVGKIGRIVVTTLINRIMPFIRYDSGDYGYYEYNQNGNRNFYLCKNRKISNIIGHNIEVSGNDFFEKILKESYSHINLSKLIYLQIIQTNINDFEIYINEFQNAYILFKYIEQEALLIMNKVFLKLIIINNNDLKNIIIQKPVLFISKILDI